MQGTENLLEACYRNNVQRFVFSSSSSVYGNRTGVCQEINTPAPLSPYAMSKLAGEQRCKKYAEYYRVSSVCLRYFNVYGPRQNPNGTYAAVISKFKQNLLNNSQLYFIITFFDWPGCSTIFICAASIASSKGSTKISTTSGSGL